MVTVRAPNIRTKVVNDLIVSKLSFILVPFAGLLIVPIKTCVRQLSQSSGFPDFRAVRLTADYPKISIEAMPRPAEAQLVFKTADGKAEPYRTKGGKAAYKFTCGSHPALELFMFGC
jgi:hypothetical protein